MPGAKLGDIVGRGRSLYEECSDGLRRLIV